MDVYVLFFCNMSLMLAFAAAEFTNTDAVVASLAMSVLMPSMPCTAFEGWYAIQVYLTSVFSWLPLHQTPLHFIPFPIFVSISSCIIFARPAEPAENGNFIPTNHSCTNGKCFVFSIHKVLYCTFYSLHLTKTSSVRNFWLHMLSSTAHSAPIRYSKSPA